MTRQGSVIESRWPQIARRVADLVEARGTNVWFDSSDSEILEELGYGESR
jgi:hypothetical protein